MATRQGVINAVGGYVAANMSDEAKVVAAALVDGVVESIGRRHNFRYRFSKKDDYSISDSDRTHDMPAGAITIIRMGKVESGKITERFWPVSEEVFTARDYDNSSFGDIHYMPLTFDEDTGIRQFTIVGTLDETKTVRVVYLRQPHKDDIRFLGELVVLMGVLRVFPSRLLGKETASADRQMFAALFQDEVDRMIDADTDSEELPIVLETDPQTAAANEWIRNI